MRKVLIANRGVIAQRVARTLRRMGILSVGVYSEADRKAPYLELMDEAYLLGGSSSSESYLNIEKILSVAKATNSDAIHPGYGFLSENAGFAKACEDAGLIFIGPPSQAIALMGSKKAAKERAATLNLNLIPGYAEKEARDTDLISEAMKIGFPLLVKAVAGGGGKGIKIVNNESGMQSLIGLARAEALQSFGDSKLIIEKYFPQAKHIEIQVLADQHGTALSLYDRECSVQRRFQKIIEEAPSISVSPELRQQLGEQACRLSTSIGYQGAGTVEFLCDFTKGDPKRLTVKDFYFLEMNTRLQVEHGVTESILDLDLVEWQVRMARGEKLDLTPKICGHSMQARIYAESVSDGFVPQTGVIREWQLDESDSRVRLENSVASGFEVSPFYDPMLAKIITRGESRDEALTALKKALENTYCLGLVTNLDFLGFALSQNSFIGGLMTTQSVESQWQSQFKNEKNTLDDVAIVAGLLSLIPPQPLALWSNHPFYWDVQEFEYNQKWYAIEYRIKNYGIEVRSGENYEVLILRQTSEGFRFEYKGRQWESLHSRGNDGSLDVFIRGLGHFHFSNVAKLKPPVETALIAQQRTSASGKIVAIHVVEGSSVQKGDRLFTLESMKMQTEIKSPVAGKIKQIHVAPNEVVKAGHRLYSLEGDSLS